MQSLRAEVGGSAFDIPDAVWRRGQTVKVVPRPAEAGQVDEIAHRFTEEQAQQDVLTAIVDSQEFVVSGAGEVYRPLVDTPSAHLAFAKLSDGPASTSGAVAFIKEYGLPAPREAQRMGVVTFMAASAEMNLAVRLRRALALVKTDSDYSGFDELADIGFAVAQSPKPDIVRNSYHWLATHIETRLSGVRFRPRVALDPPRLISEYSPPDLLGAMWLQLLDTVVSRRIIRERCKGCDQPFVAKDIRQEYCSPACRHRHAQRQYMKRNPTTRQAKEAGNGSQG